MIRKRDTGLTWEDRYRARGYARTGLSEATAESFFDDFTDMARWYKSGGLRDFVARTDCAGGVALMNLNINTIVWYAIGTGVVGYTPTLARPDQPLYCAVRMRIPLGLPMPVNHYGVIGFLNAGGTEGLVVAAGNGVSTFVGGPVRGGVLAETLDSGIPVDTIWHDFEVWYDGALYSLSVDGGVVVSGVPLHLPTGYSTPIIIVLRNGLPDVQLEIDKGLWLYPQAT